MAHTPIATKSVDAFSVRVTVMFICATFIYFSAVEFIYSSITRETFAYVGTRGVYTSCIRVTVMAVYIAFLLAFIHICKGLVVS